MIADRTSLGAGCSVDELALVGVGDSDEPAVIGDGALIRAFCIIHGGVRIGAGFRSGHHVLIREPSEIGDDVLVGTGCIIDGHVTIGSHTKLESRVYVPTHTIIGERVFLGPGATLTNDRYPLRRRAAYEPQGPVLDDDVTVGAGAVVLPGVHVGQGAMVAAGAVVTKDVPSWTLVMGNPGRFRELPADLREMNRPKVAAPFRG